MSEIIAGVFKANRRKSKITRDEITKSLVRILFLCHLCWGRIQPEIDPNVDLFGAPKHRSPKLSWHSASGERTTFMERNGEIFGTWYTEHRRTDWHLQMLVSQGKKTNNFRMSLAARPSHSEMFCRKNKLVPSL